MASEESFFRRVTRHQHVTDGPDHRENRLTEAFGAVLADGPHELGEALLTLCGFVGSGPVDAVQTQRWTGGGLRRIDLELTRGRQLCWIEIKHGAPLHRNQLRNYRSDLKRRTTSGHEARLVVLAAARFEDELELKYCDKLISWQSVATEFQCWLDGAADNRSVDAWLAREFIRYLEEGRLAMTQPLTRRDLDAIEHRQASAERFCEILHSVSDKLNGLWGQPVDTWYSPKWPTNPAADWPIGGQAWLRPQLGAGAVFGWGVERIDGTLKLLAGIWPGPNSNRDPRVLANERWVRNRCRQGFELLYDPWEHNTLARLLPLADLQDLAGSEADGIFRFVSEAHTALTRRVPAATPSPRRHRQPTER